MKPPHENHLSALVIEKIAVHRVDLSLTDAFVISRGPVLVAENLFVELTLASGVKGFGEIAPFTKITGETREESELAARRLAELWIGQAASSYRLLCHQSEEAEPRFPSTRCGLEIALLDALARSSKIPLWGFFGGKVSAPQSTDITIPILPIERCKELARQWHAKGFRIFKLKVGMDRDEDVRRFVTLAKGHPDVSFVIDANQGFTEDDTVAFVKDISDFRSQVLLLEQPVHKDDLEGLAGVRRKTGLKVAADESVFSVKDLRKVIEKDAADMVNIKIMKSGVLEAIEIATLARQWGLGLMIGGMVESRLAMACSYSIVLGFGGFQVLDLDTPLLLTQDPWKGGYKYSGPQMSIWSEPGLGMAPA